MASALDYSTTAAGNTVINGVGISGSDLPRNLDNAMREMAANAANAQPRATLKSANYIATKDDFGKTFVFNGAYTLTIPAIASLATGWFIYAEAAPASALGLARSGSNTLNGATSLSLPAGRRCQIFVSESPTDLKVDFDRRQPNDFYAGTASTATDLPVGSIVVVEQALGTALARNAVVPVYINASADPITFVYVTASSGNTLVPGTFRSRGAFSLGSGWTYIAQRTA